MTLGPTNEFSSQVPDPRPAQRPAPHPSLWLLRKRPNRAVNIAQIRHLLEPKRQTGNTSINGSINIPINHLVSSTLPCPWCVRTTINHRHIRASPAPQGRQNPHRGAAWTRATNITETTPSAARRHSPAKPIIHTLTNYRHGKVDDADKIPRVSTKGRQSRRYA